MRLIKVKVEINDIEKHNRKDKNSKKDKSKSTENNSKSLFNRLINYIFIENRQLAR